MEHEKLIMMLRTPSADAAARTPNCPDNHVLAACLDGNLPAKDNEQLAAHLADCDYCAAQLGMMQRLNEAPPAPAASEFVLARAARMVEKGQRTTFQNTARWAAAAVIVLAVLLVYRPNPSVPAVPDASVTSPADITAQALDPHQTRNLNTGILKPRVLAPVAGTRVDPAELRFAWTEVPGSLYYDVRIVTDAGDLVWQARAEDTELALPASLQLEPDTDYFFRVDAYLASAKSISSQHVLFSIGERH